MGKRPFYLPKKLKNRTWLARPLGVKPNAAISFTNTGYLRVRYEARDGDTTLYVDRRTARLLARRIDEALDDLNRRPGRKDK